jgi:hypothetical protein
LSGKARRNTGVSGWEPGSTSGSLHGIGDLFTALRRQGLIADELVLQLTTFLRSLDLFLELIVLAPRTFTANQDRHGGKQGTDNPEHSRIHSSTCPALTSLAAELSGPKINYFFNVEIIFGAQALTATKIASFRTSASGISDGSLSFHFKSGAAAGRSRLRGGGKLQSNIEL